MTTSILPMVFSSSWASGINAYLVVLVLGLAEKFGHFSQIPDFFSRTDVLIGAGVLFAIEFVADKIPYLDSTWDAISTVLRRSSRALPKPVINARRISRGGTCARWSSTSSSGSGSIRRPQSCPARMPWYRLRAMVRA